MRLSKLVLCLSSSILLSSISSYSHAAENADNEVEETVVIGTRQAYQGNFTALETPQAELSIDAEILDAAGALDLNQALDLSGSVARQNNFGGLWNSFAIRGFVGDENLPSNYLVNGFNAGRGFGGPRDLSGIESVEVLKGPRAALFGRGEPGGTINLITKRPTFENQGDIQVSIGSFSTYRTDIDWDAALSERFAVRLVAYYEDAESFRDTIETKKLGFSPSLAFRISDRSHLNYELEYSDQEIPFDRGVIAIDGQLGLIPDSRFLGEPGDGPMQADVLGHQLEFQHDFNDNWSALLGLNLRDTELVGFATENGFAAPAADGTFGRFRRFRDYDASYQVLRAELSGKLNVGGLEHRLIVGLDSDEFENDQVFLRIRNRESNQEINIFNPVYGAFPLPTPLPNTDRVETQESIGLYIQDQISLNDQWDVRIGARFDDYDQELINRRSDSVSTFSESRVSPQFGVVYKASDSMSLYASYGENFRPLSGATDDNDLEPNQSTSSEIGINFELNDGAIEGNLAFFDVDQSNISTVDADFNATAIGEAGSQGFEFDIYGNLSDDLSLWVSYSRIEAETKNDFNDPNFGTVVPAGSDLLNIPDQQFTLQLVKQTQFAGKPLSLTGGVVHVGERNGFFSNQDFKLPSYVTVRVAADYEFSDSFDIRAEINNLTDEEFFTNSFADVWVQPGAPINARLSARFRF